MNWLRRNNDAQEHKKLQKSKSIHQRPPKEPERSTSRDPLASEGDDDPGPSKKKRKDISEENEGLDKEMPPPVPEKDDPPKRPRSERKKAARMSRKPVGRTPSKLARVPAPPVTDSLLESMRQPIDVTEESDPVSVAPVAAAADTPDPPKAKRMSLRAIFLLDTPTIPSERAAARVNPPTTVVDQDSGAIPRTSISEKRVAIKPADRIAKARVLPAAVSEKSDDGSERVPLSVLDAVIPPPANGIPEHDGLAKAKRNKVDAKNPSIPVADKPSSKFSENLDVQGRQGKVGLLSFVRWGSKPIAIHQAPSSITDEKLDARGRPVRRSSLKDMNAEPRSKSVTVDAPAVRKATDPAIRSKDKEMTAAEATALLDSARDRKLPEVSDAEITTKPGVAVRPSTADSTGIPKRGFFARIRTTSDPSARATETGRAKNNRSLPFTHRARINLASSAPKAENVSVPPRLSGADQRAYSSAVVVQSLIIGQPGVKSSRSRVATSVEFHKVKDQLLRPTLANRLIKQLRNLPLVGQSGPSGPMHAVCLKETDSETQTRHFSQLETGTGSGGAPSVVDSDNAQIAKLFGSTQLINLISAPDFGLGQPVTGKGVLAGSVPSAGSIIRGLEQVTPQLMAVGYATGKTLTPTHQGVYPPTDRISVLTYWWGLEVILPPPSIANLDTCDNVAHTVINFLTALSLTSGGIKEILPFVRYIGQFIDFEFQAIKKMDQGQGVICAATWLMPIAMVPRPWDFPDPPVIPVTPPVEKNAIASASGSRHRKPSYSRQEEFPSDSVYSNVKPPSNTTVPPTTRSRHKRNDSSTDEEALTSPSTSKRKPSRRYAS